MWERNRMVKYVENVILFYLRQICRLWLNKKPLIYSLNLIKKIMCICCHSSLVQSHHLQTSKCTRIINRSITKPITYFLLLIRTAGYKTLFMLNSLFIRWLVWTVISSFIGGFWNNLAEMFTIWRQCVMRKYSFPGSEVKVTQNST